MKSLQQLIADIEELQDEAMLREFIRNGWVKPAGEEPWQFDVVDVARIRLIIHLREELTVEDDTLPLILSLIDQLYGTRRQLNQLCDAISKQPRQVQAEIFSLLEK